jgi:predicted dehydrogenase
MIQVGVIGYGYWGPNLVRNFSRSLGSSVKRVSDLRESNLKKVHELHPNILCSTNAQDLIDDTEIDAVVIATPVKSHFDLAMRSLKAGKHVFIEKPITDCSKQAIALIEEAEKKSLVIMVDHTFIYTPAVNKLKTLSSSPEFGKIRYYDSTRVNLGLFQEDVNVLWDLAVHDLSIMQFLLGVSPVAVSATGHSYDKSLPEYAAYLTTFFNDQIIGHINVNWLSPVKIRRTLVGGTRQMAIYDDLEVDEKIRIYDKGITLEQPAEDVNKLKVGYRAGDLLIPKLSNVEALAEEVKHFIDCILNKKSPMSGGVEGLELVQILEAANSSINSRGAPVEIKKYY